MITTFYGADAKCGVTMLCQEIAEALAAADTSKSVLLLNLSGGIASEYSSLKFGLGLEDIHIKLKSNVLTEEELVSACSAQDNFYMLQGTTSLKDRKEYQPEEIDRLLELAEVAFDRVLVDAGHSIDLGLTIGALLYARDNILVTTQNKQALTVFRQKDMQVLMTLGIFFSKIIVNKFYTSPRLPMERELADHYQISETVSFELSPYGLQAENDGCRLSKIDKNSKKETERVVKKLFLESKGKVRNHKSLIGILRKGGRE